MVRRRWPLLAYIGIVLLAIVLVNSSRTQGDRIERIEKIVCVDSQGREQSCEQYLQDQIDARLEGRSTDFAARDGRDGAKGTRGPIGQAGVAGRNGVRGTTGATGSQGERGVTGVAGPRGSQGSQGERGPRGPQGPPGPPGSPGASAEVNVGALHQEIASLQAEVDGLQNLVCAISTRC